VENWLWVILIIAGVIWQALSKLRTEEQDEPESPPLIPKPRPPRPQRPQQSRPSTTPRPTVAPRVPETWKVDAKQIGDFVEKASRVRQPPPPATAKPAPVASAAQAPKPVPRAAPASVEKPSRAAQWAKAMRDRDNLRNVVIATEILGPPRGA
jgi:hypothetical protein